MIELIRFLFQDKDFWTEFCIFKCRINIVSEFHLFFCLFCHLAVKTASFTYYLKAERLGRMMSKWSLTYFMSMSIVTIIVMPIALSTYAMFSGNFDTSTWLLIFEMTVPFDDSTVFGWYIKWLLQVYAVYVYNMALPTLISYFVNGCLYVNACCKQFYLDFKALDDNFFDTNSKCRLNPLEIHVKRRKIISQLSDLVKLHIKIIK